MDETHATLGQRILMAAKLATAMHLRSDMLSTARQQQAHGGAAMRLSKDGELSSDDARRQPRPERPWRPASAHVERRAG